MSKRIQNKINSNKAKIVAMLNQNIDLNYQLTLKKFKRIYEEQKNIGSKKQPSFVKVKIGCWNEFFKDSDYPDDPTKGVTIERNTIIEVDGQRSYGYQKLTYYKTDDI